jgi:predicted small secreted protein
MNKLIFATALYALTACNLAGCNTVGGLGQDLQQAGAVISGTAIGAQNATKPGRQPPASEPAAPAPLLNCQPDANGLVLEGCPQPSPH